MLRIDAKSCHVEVDGTAHILPLRGRLFEAQGDEKRPIAVGDRVVVAGGAIESVLPRRSKLSRRSAGEGDREQVLAANVTLALVTASIAEPPFQPEIVDRILAGAEREGIDAALAITKIDRDRKNTAARWIELYESLGYRVFATQPDSAAPALAELAELLHRNVTVLTGLSGVGKSSLINRLVPGLDLRIGAVGRQGRHTTTHTQLIPLPGGGHVLDTPGIRNFGLFDLERTEVAALFRELRPLLGRCAYRDCTHLVEPDCTLRAAREAGNVAPSRWRSYELLLESCDDS